MTIEVTSYLILLVGILGLTTIFINLFILTQLGKSSLRRFALQVLALMLLIVIGGYIRSNQILYGSNEKFLFLEYAIYSITYIAAYYKIYQMTQIYGFKID